MSRKMWTILLVLFLGSQFSINLLVASTTKWTGPMVLGICILGLIVMAITRQLRKVWPLTLAVIMTMFGAGLGLYFYHSHFAPMGF